MKKIIILSVFCQLLLTDCLAHPGIGIVKDSKGNIYYTDLKQVWKIDWDGNKTVVVNNVHSHELYIDANDNLYGEHLWYNGKRLNTWGHYVWCLKNDGTLAKAIDSTAGFLNSYSFVRDSAGNMYWIERFTVSRFMKRTPGGEIKKLAEGKFGFIGWIHCMANGTILFLESNKLQKLTPDGKISLLTDNLESNTTGFSMFGRNYDGYGIWTDSNDNIYIAMITAKKIIRISPDGNARTIFQSNSLWTPTSGVFDKDGNLWLLENSVTNEARARKINKEELNIDATGSVSNIQQAHIIATISTGLAILLVWTLLRFSIRRLKEKNKNRHSII